MGQRRRTFFGELRVRRFHPTNTLTIAHPTIKRLSRCQDVGQTSCNHFSPANRLKTTSIELPKAIHTTDNSSGLVRILANPKKLPRPIHKFFEFLSCFVNFAHCRFSQRISPDSVPSIQWPAN
jgi:hypothetical protein